MPEERDSRFDQRWREPKGIVDESDLVAVALAATATAGQWYECPCGGDHAAWRPWVKEDGEKYVGCLGPILTCFVTDRQWLIRAVDVGSIILAEEVAYINLLGRAPAIVQKVVAKRGWSEETRAFLADTHGIEAELSQSIVEGKQV